jgi:hypothetical protein
MKPLFENSTPVKAVIWDIHVLTVGLLICCDLETHIRHISIIHTLGDGEISPRNQSRPDYYYSQ